MSFLVTGAEGMLGREVVRELQHRGLPVTATDREQLDITSMTHLDRIRRDPAEVSWLINCAAYTAVDRAEEEFTRALSINGVGPGALAALCSERGWKMIHVSTDFVFDGESEIPYRPDDRTHPINAYGRSKLFGEEKVLENARHGVVVRTSWLYGVFGSCFPKSILKAWMEGKPLRVVADQSGNPTSARSLARVLVDLALQAAPHGLYHAAGPETMTWHEFASRLVGEASRVSGLPHDVHVEPIRTEDRPSPARRPRFSALDSSATWALGVEPMPSVDQDIHDFINDWEEVPKAVPAATPEPSGAPETP
ncbi:MAG: dTDP-4-dehydrorhamnose reductase [Fimbriimonadaceae bacterium]|nr:dTDP-4-dehydrorhamnose reductase [Fimbriimonadaceae bacterium]